MWDIKYRPLRFADVLGQDGNVHLLKSRLRNGTALDTSYIFAGGFGRGKTTLSRIHARAMLCLNLDKNDPEPCNVCSNCLGILNEQPGAFSERDAASQGKIEDIRAIVDELPFSLPGAAKRIYLFDEAHRMSTASQDVLLKPVEDKRMVAIFCTTEAEKIRGTIRSRCEEYLIRKVTREDVLKRMQKVLAEEHVEFQDDAVLIVVDHSGGHVRDVLNKLEMVAQLGPITVESVREYFRLTVVSLYYEILLSLGDPKKSIELIDRACEQAAPEDVSAGIAEAAMNTYRVANGIFADFGYVDKKLAERVFEKYKSNVIRFAQWFLGSRYTTKLSLMRDVVVFAQTQGNLPLEGPTPPIVLLSQSIPTPPSAAAATPTSVSVAAPSLSAAAAPAPAPALSAVTRTLDYTTFEDPTVPTPNEELLINGPMPRVRGHQETVMVSTGSDKPKAMNPDEWRACFEQLLRKKLPPSALLG